ncbi:hypothetical protein LRP88_12823 [Fusarium phalaenopsidis]
MAPQNELPLQEVPVPRAPWLSPTMHTALYMIAWIVSSNATVIFNKWIIDTAGFDYPILLTGWHLLFASIVTQILAHTTKLLDSRHDLSINRRFYIRTIIPIGIVSSGSLVCANVVYEYLSVAFIQMLKAGSPAVVLFVSWIWAVTTPTVGMIVNIAVIVSGVAMASAGEIAISWTGFAYQGAGLVFEAVRVVMLQVMLGGEGMNMDPLVCLYYTAPVCALVNLTMALAIELPRFQFDTAMSVGPLILLANAAVGFTVNFTSMVLIGKTSGLVTTLTGIFKNILLIACSTAIWRTEITPIQILGYSISLMGLIYYALGVDKLMAAWTSLQTRAAGGYILLKERTTSYRLMIGLSIGIFLCFITGTLFWWQRGFGIDMSLFSSSG